MSAIKPEIVVKGCGAQACVLQGIKCNPVVNNDDKPMVTKVFFDNKGYSTEKIILQMIYDKLNRIDPTERYFSLFFKDCGGIAVGHMPARIIDNYNAESKREIDDMDTSEYDTLMYSDVDKKSAQFDIVQYNIKLAEAREKVDLAKNKIIEKSKKNILHAISITDFGEGLFTVVRKGINYKDLFKSLLNVFEGINLLNTNHGYHCDIKAENIVYSDQEKICRIIDFGVSFFGEQIPVDQNGLFIPIGGTMPNMSLEYNIKNMGLPDKKKFNTKGGFTNYNNLLLYYIDSEDDDNIKFKIMVDDIFYTIKTNTVKYSELKTMDESEDPANNTYFFEKNDIWSLGILLLQLITHSDSKINDLPPKFKKELISEVILKLLIIDTKKRPDSQKALKIYKDFIIKYIDSPFKTSWPSVKSLIKLGKNKLPASGVSGRSASGVSGRSASGVSRRSASGVSSGRIRSFTTAGGSVNKKRTKKKKTYRRKSQYYKKTKKRVYKK